MPNIVKNAKGKRVKPRHKKRSTYAASNGFNTLKGGAGMKQQRGYSPSWKPEKGSLLETHIERARYVNAKGIAVRKTFKTFSGK
jgi:hypothetical protein